MKFKKSIQLICLFVAMICCKAEKLEEELPICHNTGLTLLNTDDSGLWLPSIFTPNHDLYNETYGIISNYLKQFKIRIKKDGALIYQASASASNPDEIIKYNKYGWDGAINGKEAPEGIYQVEIEGVFTNKNTFSANTNLYLMRECHGQNIKGCTTGDQYSGFGKIIDISSDYIVFYCSQ